MKIGRKLKLNSTWALASLTASVGVAVFFFDRIEGDVRQLAEVEEPLEQAILEMEINVGETARAGLGHVRQSGYDGAPRDTRRADDRGARRCV